MTNTLGKGGSVSRPLAVNSAVSLLFGNTALLGVRRSVICRPNRLPISSTATRAVRPRSSRNGLSSTISTDRTSSGIVQQLHDQMRFAIRRAARHRRADAWGHRGIEKIDVEAQMEDAVLRPHALDDLADQHADAELVERAHVGDGNAAFEHQLLLQRVDRADAEQIEPVGGDRGAGLLAEQPVETGLAAQKGRRHAVHVAGLGRLRRVVVRMGIEPKHEQRAALFTPVACDAVHRSHRQRVVASHEDRHSARARQQKGAFAERADPALDFVIKFGVGRRRSLGGLKAGWRHVAMVLDGETELAENAADARSAQRRRSHQRAGLRGADLEGNPEQGDAWLDSFGVRTSASTSMRNS